MPDIGEMSESRFLKRADVGAGKLVTITGCEKQNVAKKDEKAEYKWTLSFEELEKPLVLNKTNSELIAMISGERNSDNWSGVRVVLYDDPTISFGGKLVGGIRVRAPKGAAAQRPPTSKPPVAELEEEPGDSEIPF